MAPTNCACGTKLTGQFKEIGTCSPCSKRVGSWKPKHTNRDGTPDMRYGVNKNAAKKFNQIAKELFPDNSVAKQQRDKDDRAYAKPCVPAAAQRQAQRAAAPPRASPHASAPPPPADSAPAARHAPPPPTLHPLLPLPPRRHSPHRHPRLPAEQYEYGWEGFFIFVIENTKQDIMECTEMIRVTLIWLAWKVFQGVTALAWTVAFIAKLVPPCCAWLQNQLLPTIVNVNGQLQNLKYQVCGQVQNLKYKFSGQLQNVFATCSDLNGDLEEQQICAVCMCKVRKFDLRLLRRMFEKADMKWHFDLSRW